MKYFTRPKKQCGFLHRQHLLPIMLEKPVENQFGLLNSAAGTDHEAKTFTCAPTHFKSAAVCHAPSESKYAWQRLHHLSKAVCIGGVVELEMPKNRISEL